ncbi:hypothetical protein [Achromobacter animicus]|uniref:hypothetical protein n=1 Tax=Achromobacter animicus TaxID=1389935 RepID=UPI0028B05B57|nr:hypothetical protein [Achromobacter animicus]
MATLLRFPRFVAYVVGALLGYAAHHTLQPPVMFLTSRLSRTHIGRRAFILAARSPIGLQHVLLTILISFIAVALFLLPYLLPIWALVLVLLAPLPVFAVFNYSGRVLTVTNRGNGNWHIHLNTLRARNQTSASRWDGAFADLESVASMARAGGLQTLTLDSTLLAHAATAERLARKLTRAFSKHGLVSEVTIEEPRARGVVGTGFIHVLLARQRHLKGHRAVYQAPLNLKSRKIVVDLSPAPRSSLDAELTV